MDWEIGAPLSRRRDGRVRIECEATGLKAPDIWGGSIVGDSYGILAGLRWRRWQSECDPGRAAALRGFPV